jgi:hypothetical protein
MPRFLVGVLVLILAGFSSIMAGGFSLGEDSKPNEFGQGVYNISACDDYVRINITSGETGQFGAPEGLSALTGLTISSLDTTACAGKQITISVVDQQNQSIPMYRTDSINQLCSDNPCSNTGEIKISIDDNGNLTSVMPIDNIDSYSVSQNTQTAVFIFSFTHPAVLANSIGRIMIQTSSI